MGSLACMLLDDNTVVEKCRLRGERPQNSTEIWSFRRNSYDNVVCKWQSTVSIKPNGHSTAFVTLCDAKKRGHLASSELFSHAY